MFRQVNLNDYEFKFTVVTLEACGHVPIKKVLKTVKGVDGGRQKWKIKLTL